MRVVKSVILVVVFVFCANSLIAQGPVLNFLRTIGVVNTSVISDWDHGTSVDYDQYGNMLVAGNTRGATIFVQNGDSLTQMNSVPNNFRNIFVYKYNPSGGIEFAFTIEKVNNPKVHTLNDGSFYLIYSLVYPDSIDANPNPSQSLILTPGNTSLVGNYQVVSRFDANGMLLWAFRLDLHRGSISLRRSASAIDNSDNLIITGVTFNGSLVDVNPLGAPYSISNNSGLMLKYNSSGQILWAQDSIASLALINQGNGITLNERLAVNSKNEIILAADLETSDSVIDVDPSIGVHNLLRDSGDVIVTTYDSNGAFNRAFSFGRYNGGSFAYDNNHSDILRVDSADNIYISGTNLNGDFDPSPNGVFEFVQTPGQVNQKDDDYLVSFTSDGNLRWANAVRRNLYYNNSLGIAGYLGRSFGSYANGNLLNFRVDQNGNQYAMYYVRTKYDLDLGVDSAMVHTADFSIFINNPGQLVLTQYDSNGTYVDRTLLIDTTLIHNDYVADFIVDDACNLYVTGTVGRSHSFTNVPFYSAGAYFSYPLINGSSLESDALAVRYNLSDQAMPYLVRSKSDLQVCEGQSGNLFVGSKGEVQWYDSMSNGNLLGTGHEFQFSALNANDTFYAQTVYCGDVSPRIAVGVNVISIDTSLLISIDTLWVTETGATYQWIDCHTNLPVPGETKQYYKVTNFGTYAVQVTKNSCTEQSPCVSLTPESVHDLRFNKNFSIYPNPTKSLMHLKIDSKNNHDFYIINAQGTKVKSGIIKGELTIEVSDLQSGIYFVHVVNAGSASFKKE